MLIVRVGKEGPPRRVVGCDVLPRRIGTFITSLQHNLLNYGG